MFEVTRCDCDGSAKADPYKVHRENRRGDSVSRPKIASW